MQNSKEEFYQQIMQLIEKIIYANPLKTRRNEIAEFINPVKNLEIVLLSFEDVIKMKDFAQCKVIPIVDYLHQTIGERLKKELLMEYNNELMEIYSSFKDELLGKLMSIEVAMKQLLCGTVNKFLIKYGNGLLDNRVEFTNEFEKVITELSDDTRESQIEMHKIKEVINNATQNINKECDLIKARLQPFMLLKKKVKDYIVPKEFELVDQVVINKGKSVPSTNGIDIHPNQNVYVSMGCYDGDLVIRDQDTNKEIKRVKLNNNSSGETQNCLWSPSGNKIMVSTCKNHSIYIYDETGQKLLKSMEKTYSQNGFGAIWLSEQEVGVGYTDGVVKFFNIDEGKEIKMIKVNGKYAWGMDCVDSSRLLVGDYSGTITSIDWIKNKIEWVKTGWHSSGYFLRCLKVNQDKTKLLSCSEDNLVKLMRLQDQSSLWELKLSTYSVDVLWVPGELYVLILSSSNQLLALSSTDGAKIAEFNGLLKKPMSLRLNRWTAEVLIGNNDGIIQRLRICQEQNLEQTVFLLYYIYQYSIIVFLDQCSKHTLNITHASNNKSI